MMSMMSINQQIGTFFQMQQASSSVSYPPFTNPPQHDDENEDEDDNANEDYDDNHLDDRPLMTCLIRPSLFRAYIYIYVHFHLCLPLFTLVC